MSDKRPTRNVKPAQKYSPSSTKNKSVSNSDKDDKVELSYHRSPTKPEVSMGKYEDLLEKAVADLRSEIQASEKRIHDNLKTTLDTTVTDAVNKVCLAMKTDIINNVQDQVKSLTDTIKQEVSDSLEANKRELQQHVTQKVDEELAAVKKVLESHQKMLEQNDAKNREKNLIVTGLKEDVNLGDAGNDEDKVNKLFTLMGCGALQKEITQIKRLGNADSGRRPVLVELSNTSHRKSILDKTKVLKDYDEADSIKDALKTIYVKKDAHPSVRREWWRLHEAEKREKERPENRGVEIRLDYRTRQLMRDGVVIDKWSPVF